MQFGKQYRKALYKDGNTKKPIYHFIENEQGNLAIGKCDGGRMKEVVYKQRAIEIVRAFIDQVERDAGQGGRSWSGNLLWRNTVLVVSHKLSMTC